MHLHADNLTAKKSLLLNYDLQYLSLVAVSFTKNLNWVEQKLVLHQECFYRIRVYFRKSLNKKLKRKLH